eukprot:3945574-Heterocapsa_arctica.AAC.1
MVPTGWAEKVLTNISVAQGVLVPFMGGRTYFANECTAGYYDNKQYLALKLLGKTLRYMTDISAAGCGCNAAIYLTAMAQNTKPS